MVRRIFFCTLWAAFFPFLTATWAQKPVVIKLDNPSFEDYPQAGHQPQGWYDCGFAGETPPDVNPTGTFKVSKTAIHGGTYLGMVTRDNNTWERVGQRLKTPLLKGVSYTFSIHLARSDTYMSQSRTTGRDVNYTTPTILRIWGGMGYCGNEEMLAETEPVTSANWEKFNFKFTPKSNLDYFMIEVFYKVPTLFPYNGNILMDNASEITPIIQKEEPKVTKVEPTKPKPSTPTAKPQPSTPTAKPPVIAITRPLNKTSVTTPSVELRATTTNIGEKSQISLTVNGQAVTNFDFDKNIRLIRANVNLEEGENVFAISATTKDGSYSTSSSVNYVKQVKAVTPEEKPVVGSIIKIEKLQFAPNSAIIEKESYSSLDGIYQFLASNDNMVVEIGGHTNLIVTGDMSIRLSTDRARAVAEYLINKGIEKKRLIVKGYGNSFPVEQGTSAAANKANQRVEIKILSING